jgi:hypothetical protein
MKTQSGRGAASREQGSGGEELTSAPSPRRSSAQIIRASDLAQYKYCARAWWLGSVLGAPSANVREMQHGEAAHQAHGRKVWASSALLVVAAVLVVLAIVLFVASLPL